MAHSLSPGSLVYSIHRDLLYKTPFSENYKKPEKVVYSRVIRTALSDQSTKENDESSGGQTMNDYLKSRKRPFFTVRRYRNMLFYRMEKVNIIVNSEIKTSEWHKKQR